VVGRSADARGLTGGNRVNGGRRVSSSYLFSGPDTNSADRTRSQLGSGHEGLDSVEWGSGLSSEPPGDAKRSRGT
jgi:hypothetical protein